MVVVGSADVVGVGCGANKACRVRSIVELEGRDCVTWDVKKKGFVMYTVFCTNELTL
jgi:hypothetical protein